MSRAIADQAICKCPVWRKFASAKSFRLRMAACAATLAHMRVAIIDESAVRASVMQEGLAQLGECEIFVVTERRGLVRRISEIDPDIVLMDLGNPSRDVLEEYFAVSRALARPIAMFVDDSDEESIGASIDAGVSAYVVDGFAAHRIRSILDLAIRRFHAFSRLQNDLADARGKLAEREAVDGAKRILMQSRRLTEPEAYAQLRKAAMDQGKRIADIAEAVITADKIMGGGL
jgi:response regulator NasT